MAFSRRPTADDKVLGDIQVARRRHAVSMQGAHRKHACRKRAGITLRARRKQIENKRAIDKAWAEYGQKQMEHKLKIDQE